MSQTDLLEGIRLRPVSIPDKTPFTPAGLALGNGPSALEILVICSPDTPQTTHYNLDVNALPSYMGGGALLVFSDKRIDWW